jgi:hypothetical protein
VDTSPLNDKVIRSLNDRLNNIDNEEARAAAAMDFFQIMDKHPELGDDPVYKPYVDAFTQKIMSDTSPLVRTGAELAMQLGKVKNPPPAVIAELQKLSRQKGFFDFESGTAASILESLNGAGTIENKPQPVATPPANPGIGAASKPGGNPQTAQKMPQPAAQGGSTPAAPSGSMPSVGAGGATPAGLDNLNPENMDPAQLMQMMQALGGQAGASPEAMSQMLQSLGGPAGLNASMGSISPRPAAPATLNTLPGNAALPQDMPGTRLNTVSLPQQVGASPPVRMAGRHLDLREGGTGA